MPPRHRRGYARAPWPMWPSTPSSARSSATCSTSSVPRHRRCSSRGRRAISPRTSSFASTTASPAPGLVVPGAWGRFAERRTKSAHLDGTTPRWSRRFDRDRRRGFFRIGWVRRVPEPQRVLRPPRGRPQSQRSWSANERRPRMDEALWRNVGLAPWFLARRLRGVGLELEWAGTDHSPFEHGAENRPPTSPDLRASCCSTSSGGRRAAQVEVRRARRGGRSPRPRPVRHVAGVRHPDPAIAIDPLRMTIVRVRRRRVRRVDVPLGSPKIAAAGYPERTVVVGVVVLHLGWRRSGQYPLPFDGLARHPRPHLPTPPPAPAAPGRAAGPPRGRQLRLPLTPPTRATPPPRTPPPPTASPPRAATPPRTPRTPPRRRPPSPPARTDHRQEGPLS